MFTLSSASITARNAAWINGRKDCIPAAFILASLRLSFGSGRVVLSGTHAPAMAGLTALAVYCT